MMLAGTVRAQDSLSSRVTIRFEDRQSDKSTPIEWEAPFDASQLDSAWIALATVEELRRRGYWQAEIFQITHQADKNQWVVDGALHSVCRWGNIYMQGDTLDESGNYSAYDLEKTVDHYLDNAEEEGYLLANVSIDSIWVSTHADPCRISASITTQRGPQVRVGGFVFPKLKHVDPQYVKRASGIRDSMVVTPQLLENARLRLEQTELFNQVDRPVVVQRDSIYLIKYELEEQNPNRFDVLVGYVPNTGQESGGTIVGNADIRIRNLIWEGSDSQLHFERLQVQVSKFDLGLERNWIAGYPLSVGTDIHFLQQDTAYQTRSIRLQTGYEVIPGAKIYLSGRREIIAANENATPQTAENTTTAGLALDAETWYGGVQLTYERVDKRLNPSKGLRFQLRFESGIKNITDARADADSIANRLQPSIISSDVYFYQSLWPRHVLAPSLHGYANVLDQYTENDLARFGGARSLRGYREDQFRASRLVWGDLEYRYQLEANSYAFVFGSMGYYERPRLVTEMDKQRAQVDWLSSYGLGFSYKTRLGQLKFSYAISPEDSFSNGKVHFGVVGSL